MPRGEWIKRMTEERTENDQIIQELKVYLMSDKFQNDTTVQVKDVLNRLINYKSKETK